MFKTFLMFRQITPAENVASNKFNEMVPFSYNLNSMLVDAVRLLESNKKILSSNELLMLHLNRSLLRVNNYYINAELFKKGNVSVMLKHY